MAWLIGAVVYILIGFMLLVWAVKTDEYGGLILHAWWAIVFFYPYFIIRNLIKS